MKIRLDVCRLHIGILQCYRIIPAVDAQFMLSVLGITALILPLFYFQTNRNSSGTI